MDSETHHEWEWAPAEHHGSSSFSLIRCTCGFPPHNQDDVDRHNSEHNIPSAMEVIQRLGVDEVMRRARAKERYND